MSTTQVLALSTVFPTFLHHAGVKRKSNQDHYAQAENANDIQASLRKKCRSRKPIYNAKYMSAMCYSAFADRRRERSQTPWSKHTANAFKENLVHVLTEVKCSRFTTHIAAAREILPLLARAQASSKRISEDALPENFADAYQRIANTLDHLDQLASRIVADEAFLQDVKETLAVLHQESFDVTIWHDVLPYTDISLSGLRKLGDCIKELQEFAPIRGSILHVEQIEGWLKRPESRLEISDNLKWAAFDALEAASEKKIGKMPKFTAVAGPTIPHPEVPVAQAVAERSRPETRKEEEKEGEEGKDYTKEYERQQKEQLDEEKSNMLDAAIAHAREAMTQAQCFQSKAKQQIIEASEREANTQKMLQIEQTKREVAEAGLATQKAYMAQREADLLAPFQSAQQKAKMAEAALVAANARVAQFEGHVAEQEKRIHWAEMDSGFLRGKVSYLESASPRESLGSSGSSCGSFNTEVTQASSVGSEDIEMRDVKPPLIERMTRDGVPVAFNPLHTEFSKSKPRIRTWEGVSMRQKDFHSRIPCRNGEFCEILGCAYNHDDNSGMFANWAPAQGCVQKPRDGLIIPGGFLSEAAVSGDLKRQQSRLPFRVKNDLLQRGCLSKAAAPQDLKRAQASLPFRLKNAF